MNLRDAVDAALPLRVRGLEVSDPVLTLFGDEWSLNLMCPWTVTSPDRTFSWESEDLEDLAWDLVGRSIVGVIGSRELIDPTFVLTGEVNLLVRADTDLDPWALMLPELTIVGRTGAS